MRDELQQITDHIDTIKETKAFIRETANMTSDEMKKALFKAKLAGRRVDVRITDYLGIGK